MSCGHKVFLLHKYFLYTFLQRDHTVRYIDKANTPPAHEDQGKIYDNFILTSPSKKRRLDPFTVLNSYEGISKLGYSRQRLPDKLVKKPGSVFKIKFNLNNHFFIQNKCQCTDELTNEVRFFFFYLSFIFEVMLQLYCWGGWTKVAGVYKSTI